MTTRTTSNPDSTITTGDVRLSDGTRVQYATVGRDGDTPVVLLHGLSDSWRSFEPVLHRLGPGVRAVAITYRGHGDTDKPDAGYRPADLAADVIEVLDQLHIDRAVFVGHSLGVAVSLRLATAHPDHVAGLVLMAGFATTSTEVLDEFAEVIGTLTDPIDPDFIAEFQHSTVGRPVSEAFMDQAIAESTKVPAHVWHAAAAGFLGTDHLEGLGAVTAPTLVLWGDQDAYVPRADQDKFVAALPHARLTVYEQSGHALHWEQPDRVTNDLTAFIRTLSR